MEGTPLHPTCLFVGAPDVGKFTLIRALQPCTEPKSPSPANYSLRLDTKYYTADVAVRAITTQQQDQQPQLPPEAWEQLQALVLVFDASSQASFANVRSWANARDTDSIEVKLLVANKADTLQQQAATGTSGTGTSLSCRPQWLQEAMSWCVDEGFEYVEAAAGKPAVDAALRLDGEQQGAARVLAALQAHMWPGMVQKDWQPRALPDVRDGATTAAAAVGAGVGSSSGSGSKDQGSPAPAAAADAADTAGGSTAGAAAAADSSMVASHEQQQQVQQHANMQPSHGSDAAGKTALRSQPQHRAAAAAAPADEDEADLDLDDFEQMMKQLQGMRARLSHLPDDERRSAAADMALKLASMWGLGEEGSEDGEEAAAARADGQQQLDVRK